MAEWHVFDHTDPARPCRAIATTEHDSLHDTVTYIRSHLGAYGFMQGEFTACYVNPVYSSTILVDVFDDEALALFYLSLPQ